MLKISLFAKLVYTLSPKELGVLNGGFFNITKKLVYIFFF